MTLFPSSGWSVCFWGWSSPVASCRWVQWCWCCYWGASCSWACCAWCPLNSGVSRSKRVVATSSHCSFPGWLILRLSLSSMWFVSVPFFCATRRSPFSCGLSVPAISTHSLSLTPRSLDCPSGSNWNWIVGNRTAGRMVEPSLVVICKVRLPAGWVWIKVEGERDR